jgi:hypothetical protein
MYIDFYGKSSINLTILNARLGFVIVSILYFNNFL